MCKIKAKANGVFQFQLIKCTERCPAVQGTAPLGSSEGERGPAPVCGKNEEQNRSFNAFYPTHMLRQWAAVMTHLLLIRVPPQM